MTIEDGMILLVLVAGYFGPTIAAFLEKSAALPLVFFINLFFGWTLIGWVACIVVGASAPDKKQLAHKEKVRRAGDEFYPREQEKFAAAQGQATK